MKPIRQIPTAATRLLAICGKCSRKIDGGFGPGDRQPLAKALKRSLALPKPKHAALRLVETRCLKLCPKGAVAIADSASPGFLIVVPAGTPLAEIAIELQLPPPPPPPAQRTRVARASTSTMAATASGTSAQADPATSSGAAAASPPDSTYSDNASSSDPRWRR